MIRVKFTVITKLRENMEETIDKYLKELQLTEPILKKVNKYRKMAHNEPIDIKSTIEPKFC